MILKNYLTTLCLCPALIFLCSFSPFLSSVFFIFLPRNLWGHYHYLEARCFLHAYTDAQTYNFSHSLSQEPPIVTGLWRHHALQIGGKSPLVSLSTQKEHCCGDLACCLAKHAEVSQACPAVVSSFTHTHMHPNTHYTGHSESSRGTQTAMLAQLQSENTLQLGSFSLLLFVLGVQRHNFWEASGGTRPMMLSQPDKHITTHDLFHLTSICVITSRTRSKSSHLSHLHMTYWKSSVAVCGSIPVLKTSVYRWGLLIAYGLMWWRSVLAAKTAVLDSQRERKSQEKEGEMKEKRERGRGILHYRLIHHHRDCSSTFFISLFVLYSSFSFLNLLTPVLHLNLF